MAGGQRRRGVPDGAWPALAVAATLAVQLGVLALVPPAIRLLVSTVLLALWLAGSGAIVVFAHSRRARRTRAAATGAIAAPPAARDAHAPSPRMQAGWRLAREGADAARVAELADLPMALAQLLVEDARRTPAGEDPPPGPEAQPG